MNQEGTPAYPKVYLYKRIVQAKLFMDQHYASPIDLNNIADEAFFSKFHFIRLFKKIYGKAPHQYLITVRMERAMQLLRLNASVTETCFTVGFQSVSSFTSLFKKYAGVSPSVYLQRHQQHINAIKTMPLMFIPGCFASKAGWK
jgi:AraC-like DNA-binding protein